MNASIASNDDDGIRKIAALDFVPAKDVYARALERREDGIGFVRMKDRSNAHGNYEL